MDLISNDWLRFAAAVTSVALGLLVAVVASQKAVSHTVDLAVGTRLPRFVIGFTLLGIGTDLPEIANSVVSSLTGHGDLNVGDSVGSAATQVTLILGLLPIIGSATFPISRRRLSRVGLVTVGALLMGVALMQDGFISRLDALLLLGAWGLGTALTWGPPPVGAQLDLQLGAAEKLKKTAIIVGSLVLVGGGAILAVWGMTVIAEALSIPEYLIAFFVAAIGTSLPELVVTVTALRQGQLDLAIGDAVGSSFADSTLSVAAGPLIAPVAVTASFVIPGSLVTAAVVTFVVGLLVFRGRHDWKSGLVMIAVYSGFYALAISL